MVMGPWQPEDGEHEGGTTAIASVGTERALATDPAAPRAEDTAPGSATRVSLAGSRLVMLVPPGFAVAADADEVAAAGATAACPEDFDRCVYVADESGAAGVAVTVREDLDSEAACVLDPSPGFEASLPSVRGSEDHVVALFGTVTLPGDGEGVALGLRRLRYAGVCYELVSRAVAPQGEPVDAAEARLAPVLNGVTLPDGRSALWAGGR